MGKTISDYQRDYANATTDAQRQAAHAGAEAIRASQGYSGGAAGNQYIPISPTPAPAAPNLYRASSGSSNTASNSGYIPPGAMWNSYGEIIGVSPTGQSGTIHGSAGTDIHGGWNGTYPGAQSTPTNIGGQNVKLLNGTNNPNQNDLQYQIPNQGYQFMYPNLFQQTYDWTPQVEALYKPMVAHEHSDNLIPADDGNEPF